MLGELVCSNFALKIDVNCDAVAEGAWIVALLPPVVLLPVLVPVFDDVLGDEPVPLEFAGHRSKCEGLFSDNLCLQRQEAAQWCWP